MRKICLYLQALNDDAQSYMDSYPPVDEESLIPGAVKSLEEIRDMCAAKTDNVPEDSGPFYYAGQFAKGFGRAYIGYSEAMSVMGENVSGLDFRLFSSTDGDDIPVLYVDAAAVNSKIDEKKKGLALELLNLITGSRFLTLASARNGDPRYLLTARTSVYDALLTDYPVYAGLKEIASVPDAHVFRIKPDGVSYMRQAKENAKYLPDPGRN